MGSCGLAGTLAVVAAVLVWCVAHIHNDVLPSQQPCEMSYMHAAYSPVDVRCSGRCESPAAAAMGFTAPSPSQTTAPDEEPLPPWATGIASAARRTAEAVEEVAQDKYRLWRYTGDGADTLGATDGGGLALPVLFIPGNGGSHEMGRSLASETVRRVSRLGPRALSPVRLEWYLADLGGEWSAFDGDILERQVRFTLAAMRHIAREHNITTPRSTSSSGGGGGGSGSGGGGARGATGSPGGRAADTAASASALGAQAGPRRPLAVHPGLVVVAHSMGGVVAADAIARAADDPELGPSLAALLLTLGSPHTRPVLPGYPPLAAFYGAAASRPRPVVPVAALAGGPADVQVAAALADPAALAPEGHSLRLALPQLPGAWCPAPHNALVWCNQAVAALGAALVDAAQDAAPALAAARRAAAAAAAASAATAVRSPGGLLARGPDDALLREGHREEAGAAAGGGDGGGDGGDRGGGGGGALLPWDWALRRLRRQLGHPAQGYLAAALAATAPNAVTDAADADAAAAAAPNAPPAAESEEEGATEGDAPRAQTGAPGTGLLRAAQAALAPAAAGGAGCGGANLAWYLQYNAPQPQQPQQPRSRGRGRGRRGGSFPALRLSGRDLEVVPRTGRMFSWTLAARTGGGGAGAGAGSGSSGGGGHRGAAEEEAAARRSNDSLGRRQVGSGGGGAGMQGWAAVISGASPCVSFRAWLSVVATASADGSPPPPAAAGAEAGAAAGGGSGHGSGDDGGDPRERREALEAEARRALAAPPRTVRHDVDVTGLAAPLPPLVPAGRWPVRVRSEWHQVVQGRDYQSRAAWLLLLPPSTVLPLLQQPGAPTLGLDLSRGWDGEGAAGGNGGGGGSGGSGSGAGAGAGGPTVTVTLTLWLSGEAQHPPAFRLVAAPLPSQQPQPALPTPLGLPLGPTGLPSTTESRSSAAPPAATTSPNLVVQVHLPYSSYIPYGRGRAAAAAVAALRWIGVYYYAALRVTPVTDSATGSSAAGVAGAGADAGSAGGGGGGGMGAAESDTCLYPVVLMVGPGGAPRQLPGTRILQVSANRTLHPLEPCASEPGGCAAVAAVLDPACSHRLDLVPYAAQRLPALLLSNLGRVWLGAQLASLLAVLAAAALSVAAPAGRSEGVDGPGAPVTAAVAAATPAAVRSGGGRRRFRGWVALPAEGLHVLQAPLQRRALLTALLLGTGAAARLLALSVPPLPSEEPREGVAEGHGGGAGGSTARPATSSPQALVWPWMRHAASAAGLCSQPQLQGCGWGALQLPFGPAPGGATTKAGAVTHGSPGEPQCVLDWLALAAAALLAAWLLTAVLQAAATLAGLAAATVRLAWVVFFVLPTRVVTWPFLALLRLWSRSASGVPAAAVAASAGRAASAAPRRRAGDTVALRWVSEATLGVALVALAEAPSAAPAAVLLVSVLALARELTAPSAVLASTVASEPPPSRSLPGDHEPPDKGGDADLVRQQPQQPLRPPQKQEGGAIGALRLRQRRRLLAWLLYYAAYGITAAPAVAAALRRIVVRSGGVAALVAAAAQAVGEVAAVVAEGRGVEALKLGLRWAAAGAPGAVAAAAAAGAGVRWAVSCGGGGQAGYVLAALHCASLAHAAGVMVAGAAGGGGGGSSASDSGVAGSAPCSAARPAPTRRGGVHSGLTSVAAAAVGCFVLGLAWWLGAPGAAHVVAGAGAATATVMSLLLRVSN